MHPAAYISQTHLFMFGFLCAHFKKVRKDPAMQPGFNVFYCGWSFEPMNQHY